MHIDSDVKKKCEKQGYFLDCHKNEAIQLFFHDRSLVRKLKKFGTNSFFGFCEICYIFHSVVSYVTEQINTYTCMYKYNEMRFR